MYSPLDRKPANNKVTSCISSGFPDNLNQPFWLERGTVGLKCFDQEQCSETPSQPMDYSTQGPLNRGPLIPGPLNPGPLNPGPLKPESSIMTTGPLYLPPWKEVLINIAVNFTWWLSEKKYLANAPLPIFAQFFPAFLC